MQHHCNVMMTDIAATNLSSKEVQLFLWLVNYKVYRHRASAMPNVIAIRLDCNMADTSCLSHTNFSDFTEAT